MSYLQSATPLTDEQLQRVAPSIFASSAHESRSSRYTYVPTIDVLNGLRREGFAPFAVSQSRTRDVGRREYTKHMLRLRHVSERAREVNDVIPEIVLVNSHDGSSSYQMLAGLFRLVCKNGLVVADSTVESIRVPHTGDIVGRVIEGAYTVVDEFDRIREKADSWRGLELDAGEQQAFARAALVAKYGEAPAYPVTEAQVLQARRSDDTAPHLWSVFNRAQENLVRGGLLGRSATGRRQRTREVRGISQNVQLNRALWTLAEEMAKLKA